MHDTVAHRGAETVPGRVAATDWDALGRDLDTLGCAVTPQPWLTPAECRRLAEGFTDDRRYRSTVDMRRHRFGEGVYRYFRHPLPEAVTAVRSAAYGPLAAIANRWQEALGRPDRFPARLDDFLARCHAADQRRPTPLILRYEAGGYNCLHQDLYGEVAFPLQVTVALTTPGRDFEGGENLFVEQRPRAQSRGTAVSVPLGHAVVFPTRERPERSSRGGHRRVGVRHGVSAVRSGVRLALGVIFHDAR
jgi:hypothetical protein